jgi:hypothetical protein
MSPEQAAARRWMSAPTSGPSAVSLRDADRTAGLAGDTVSDTIVDPRAIPSGPRFRPACRCARRTYAARPRTRRSGCATSVMRIEIDAAGEIPPGGLHRRGALAHGSAWRAWVALAALATAVAIWGCAGRAAERPCRWRTLHPITDWEGTEAAADISPDGRFVTFLADRDGQFDPADADRHGRFSKLTPAARPTCRPATS